MDIDRLKRLAAHLRPALKYGGLRVTHGQALDLIAALPGLRNWPEVIAFPDRLAACLLDRVAVERVLRAASRYGTPRIMPESLLWLLEMAEYQAVTPRRSGTERLIVTTDYSGSGHIKASRIADQVIAVCDRLVSGPVPAAIGPAAFFEAREAVQEADPFYADQLNEWDRATPAVAEWETLLAACRRHARVELWIDPTPNEQLLGLRLIDWLSREPDVLGKLFIVHADTRLGGRSVPHIHTMNPEVRKVGARESALAARAWVAYRQPTPEAWYGLLDSDLDALPLLRRAVLLLLGELPAVGSALGATERLLLRLVEPGEIKASNFFLTNTQGNVARVFGYWEEGRILDHMAVCMSPVVVGLREGPFDIALHDDWTRYSRYTQSRLSLSNLGHAVLSDQDDFSRHNRIHRWWGGTLLTNDHLWRWDAASAELVAPR